MPTIVTAQTFCASRDTRVSYEWCLLIRDIFARFKTIRGKQNLASAFGIQKENWGVTMHFLEIVKLLFGKNAIHCFAFYVMFKTRAAVFYRDLKPRGAAEWF